MGSDDATVRELDVRTVENPFEAITDALDTLEAGTELHLLNSFEPVPLYDVLEERGFTYEATEEDGTWRVVISRE